MTADEYLVDTIAVYLAKQMTPPDRPADKLAFMLDAENIVEIVDTLRGGEDVRL